MSTRPTLLLISRLVSHVLPATQLSRLGLPEAASAVWAAENDELFSLNGI